MRKRHGFTLIELLVVIAIIALLMAIRKTNYEKNSMFNVGCFDCVRGL